MKVYGTIYKTIYSDCWRDVFGQLQQPGDMLHNSGMLILSWSATPRRRWWNPKTWFSKAWDVQIQYGTLDEPLNKPPRPRELAAGSQITGSQNEKTTRR